MEYKELEEKTIIWANARGLLKPENAKGQFLKFISEAGELADAILKNDTFKIKDGFGDVLVTIIILAEQTNNNLIECLEIAYNEIANRKGKTNENGVFVKESDLKEIETDYELPFGYYIEKTKGGYVLCCKWKENNATSLHAKTENELKALAKDFFNNNPKYKFEPPY